ncbi:A-kinase anchor protein 14 [Pseudorca crassidens]|uniref:A-kinase anchor protein 14 n=1 Tax=Pseudorca crassidens TaxID=82174 RepID=UPI00352E438E
MWIKVPTSQMMDTEDTQNVTELALAVAKNVIAAAIKFVEEAKKPIKNIDWITQGEFTEERGRKQIEDFVSHWKYHGRWVHYTEFLKREDVIHSFHYIYCVHWSIPTARRPIPRISASVYFTIKINTNKPPDTPIDVSYVFESHSVVHRPGTTHFQEKCLRDIIEGKYILMNSNIFQLNRVRIFPNILGIDFSSECVKNTVLYIEPQNSIE